MVKTEEYTDDTLVKIIRILRKSDLDDKEFVDSVKRIMNNEPQFTRINWEPTTIPTIYPFQPGYPTHPSWPTAPPPPVTWTKTTTDPEEYDLEMVPKG